MKLSTLILGLFCLSFVYAQGADLTIKSVSLYPNSAEIHQEGTIQLKKGVHNYTIKGLSNSINEQSIRVKLSDAQILSVQHRLNHQSPNALNNPKFKVLQDSLHLLEKSLLELKDELEALNMQMDLIKSNKNIKGEEVLAVADVDAFLNYYAKKVPAIQEKIRTSSKEQEKHKALKSKIEKQLRELNNSERKSSGEIHLEIASAKTTSLPLSIFYVTYNASWQPFYNVRANEDENLNLEYMAEIQQNTGEDWKGVELNLATGNPDFNSTPPEIYRWELRNVPESRQLRGIPVAAKLEDKKMFKSKSMIRENSKQVENLLFNSFQLATPFSMNSGEKSKSVLVKAHQIKGSYAYFAIPKLSDKVYLQASILDWEKYTLLPGKSKIYYNDTYVGSSYINPNTSEDTLNISLGYDPKINIQREKVKEEKSKRFIGGQKKMVYQYAIEVKNGKSQNVKIRIKDQIPVSTDKQIEVVLKEKSDAQLMENKGFLIWDMELKAGSKQKVIFEYEITFPKDYNLNL